MPNKFEHFKKLSTEMQDTKEYTFYEIEGHPTLIVSPATESNKKYYNAALRMARTGGVRSRNSVTVKTLAQTREQERDLYPKYIVKDWKDVTDVDGKVVEFNEEDCRGFINALPLELFDELRFFCGDFKNFAEEDEELEDKEVGES